MEGATSGAAGDAGEGERPRPSTSERRRSASRDPKVFVLLRELSEVHLLLDNVSANPATTVSELIDDDRLEKQGLEKNWIEKVCEISWPPDGSNEEKADDAALLIRAKDYLNRLTHPASGSTIAFTHLVTQEGRAKRRGWTRWLVRPRDAEDAGGTAEKPDDGRRATRSAATRRSLAETAYPDLVAKAESFRKAMWLISIGLVLALFVTCGLSWYVAYGNATLTELAAARQAVTEARTRIAEAETAEASQEINPNARRPSGSAGRPAEAAPAVAAPPATPSVPFTPYCERGRFTGPTQAQLCDALSQAERDRIAAEQRVSDWMCLDTFGECDSKLPDGPSRAGALATIMASAVLPFLYGLLGAGAAIIRSLSRKIRASLLSPRDLVLSFQQLALGAVVGACIGLFVAAPGGDPNGESLLGPVTLSSSAISFVAGFGVDSVFEALESLIGRIFNVRRSGQEGRANGAH